MPSVLVNLAASDLHLRYGSPGISVGTNRSDMLTQFERLHQGNITILPRPSELALKGEHAGSYLAPAAFCRRKSPLSAAPRVCWGKLLLPISKLSFPEIVVVALLRRQF